MGIDWFTFAAQTVNLIILILLLRHFLYRPVMRAMEQREQKIAAQLEEAAQQRQEAREQQEQARSHNAELEDRRQELLEQARQEVEQQRQELLKKARQEVERSRASWRKAVEAEQRSLLEGLRQDAGEQIYLGVKQALQDLAGRSCEQQVIETFVQRLQGTSDEQRDRLASSLGDGPVNIRSTFEVPDELRPRLEQALKELTGRKPKLHFEPAEELICGIELNADGHTIGWSVMEYLAGLERQLEQTLTQQGSAPGPRAQDSQRQGQPVEGGS